MLLMLFSVRRTAAVTASLFQGTPSKWRECLLTKRTTRRMQDGRSKPYDILSHPLGEHTRLGCLLCSACPSIRYQEEDIDADERSLLAVGIRGKPRLNAHYD